jgi:hypothetical protein
MTYFFYFLAGIGGLWLVLFLLNILADAGPTCKTQEEAEEAVRKYRERNP